MRLPTMLRRHRRGLARWAVAALVIGVVAVLGAWWLQSAIPRRIVLASGTPGGMSMRVSAISARGTVITAS